MDRVKLAWLLALGTVVTAIGGTGCQQQADPAEYRRLSGMAAYIRGYEAFQEGDRDTAVRSLAQAVDDNPQLITARGMLADILRREGNYEEAAEHYERLTALDPYNYLNFYHLGVSYHFLERVEAAIIAYQGALRLRPDDPKTNMNIGLAYMVLGDAERALPYARKAVALDPSSAAALGNYALVLDSVGDHEEAEQAYRKSLEMDPTQVGVRINYSANLVRQGRPREAIPILEQVVAEQRTVLAVRRLGDAYAAAGNVDRAMQLYQEALEMNPRYYPALNAMAELQIRQYQEGLQLDESLRRQALDLWRQSLQIRPQQPQVTQQIEKLENVGMFGS